MTVDDSDETPQSHLLRVPKELRLEIYECALIESKQIKIRYRCHLNTTPYIAYANHSIRCGLVLTSHQIRS